MAHAAKTGHGDAAARRPAKALAGAIATGLIAFLLFAVIVGMKTETAPEGGGLILSYRWWTVLGLAAAIALGRLLLDLFVWNRPAHHGATFQSPLMRMALLMSTGVLYVCGAVFFFHESIRTVSAEFVGSLFSSSDWSARAEKIFEIVEFLSIGVFVILSLMMLMLAIRRSLNTQRHEQEALTLNELRRQFTLALFIGAIALPLLAMSGNQNYMLTVGAQILTYVMLGWGLNIVVGLAGLLDLGYVAFYAVGAYSYALLSTTFGLSFWVCLPLAGLLAALWGIILGFPVLRLRGDYLAIVTMAFGEIIHTVLKRWSSVTNGSRGISDLPPSFFGLETDSTFLTIFMYYLILVLALVVHIISTRLRRLPLGRAWEALREDEVACRSLGINTVTTKLTAFAIGAMFAGFAGAFFAASTQFITPESFTFMESASVLAIVVLGGMGSQVGIAIAAIVLVGTSEAFRGLEEYRMLIFGLSMMVIMVWRPRGIVGSRTPSVALKETKAISGSLVKEGAG
jgi:branched-chain amino acid transport system permease protein